MLLSVRRHELTALRPFDCPCLLPARPQAAQAAGRGPAPHPPRTLHELRGKEVLRPLDEDAVDAKPRLASLAGASSWSISGPAACLLLTSMRCFRLPIGGGSKYPVKKSYKFLRQTCEENEPHELGAVHPHLGRHVRSMSCFVDCGDLSIDDVSSDVASIFAPAISSNLNDFYNFQNSTVGSPRSTFLARLCVSRGST